MTMNNSTLLFPALSDSQRVELRRRVNEAVEQQSRRSEIGSLIASIGTSGTLFVLGSLLSAPGDNTILFVFMSVAICINLLLHSMTVKVRGQLNQERLRNLYTGRLLNAMLTSEMLDENEAEKAKRMDTAYRLSDDGELELAEEDLSNASWTGDLRARS